MAHDQTLRSDFGAFMAHLFSCPSRGRYEILDAESGNI